MINAGTSATVVSQHFGCTRKTTKHLRRWFSVTGNVQDHPRSDRSHVTTAADDRYIRSTYVTGVWLQQQLEDSMVFIHRLSEISWDKTINLFMCTNCTLLKFSPDVIKQQNRICAAVTCTSNVLIRIWFCIPMNVGLTLAMLTDARVYGRRGERFADACVIKRNRFWGGSVLVFGRIIYSVTLTACAAVSQHALYKMVDTWDTDALHWIFSLFLLFDTPPNEFKPVLLCNCVLQN